MVKKERVLACGRMKYLMISTITITFSDKDKDGDCMDMGGGDI